MVDGSIDEFHIEQLPRLCHFITHWSVGAIGSVLARKAPVFADVPVKAWQKAVGWKAEKNKRVAIGEGLKAYEGQVKSDDELAAIGMGIYWSNKLHAL
jgi:hypothetical protein